MCHRGLCVVFSQHTGRRRLCDRSTATRCPILGFLARIRNRDAQGLRRYDFWPPKALEGRSCLLYIQCRYLAATRQIAKWGNSLGVRLPKSVALEADIDRGDTVDVTVKSGAIVIRPSRPTYSFNQLVGKITSRNRHGESDWGEAVGHETW